jgi:hypothetical protein
MPQGYVHSPTLCNNLVAKDLATWTHPGVYLLIMLMTFYYTIILLQS